MYQALYRKWRPRSFDEVVGQEHITRTLARQVADGRLSHAYLFTGTRGTGKTTCAKILARAVNCEHPVNGSPCNKCPSCRGIENGSILDVMELDAASNNKVDDIRAILEEAVYTPATVKKRVYIVDEVHMLSAQAFNALLQILEEPPEHLMFILATTELNKVPATIKSRCQQFAFKRIHPEQLAGRLDYVAKQEGIDLTDEGAALIARLADGGLRDGLSLLDQCAAVGEGPVDEARVLSTLGLAGNIETAALLEDAANGDVCAALERLGRLYAGGKEMSALAGELSALLRDLLVRRTAPKAGGDLLSGGFDDATLKRLSARFDIPRLVQMLTLVQKTAADLARSANRRTDLELCLTMLCDPTLDGSATGLSARVARLEQGGVPAPAVSAAAPAPEVRPAPKPVEEQPAPQPVEEQPAPQPVEEQPAPQAEPVRSAPAAGRWQGWPVFRERLKALIPVTDYGFLGTSTMAEGRFDGETVTLWAANDFVRNMLERPHILRPVAELARQMTGVEAKVKVRVGPAPAEDIPAAPAAPSGQGDDPPDALDDFLASNSGNITVE